MDPRRLKKGFLEGARALVSSKKAFLVTRGSSRRLKTLFSRCESSRPVENDFFKGQFLKQALRNQQLTRKQRDEARMTERDNKLDRNGIQNVLLVEPTKLVPA